MGLFLWSYFYKSSCQSSSSLFFSIQASSTCSTQGFFSALVYNLVIIFSLCCFHFYRPTTAFIQMSYYFYQCFSTLQGFGMLFYRPAFQYKAIELCAFLPLSSSTPFLPICQWKKYIIMTGSQFYALQWPINSIEIVLASNYLDHPILIFSLIVLNIIPITIIAEYMHLQQLILLLLIPFASLAQNQCIDLVLDWVQNPTNLPPIIYADSGKFLNDLGDYNNCLFNKNQYTYFTMQVVNRLVGGLQNMGFCVPNDCQSVIQSNQTALQVQDSLNNAYQTAMNSTFQPFVKLKFYNPVLAKPVMDWSNYLTIAFLLTLVLVGIIGSFISKITQSQSLTVKVFKSFSLYDNFTKIIHIPKHTENENLLFLNGVRVLSIFWIVFGHDMWFRFINIKNWTETIQILTTPGVPTLVPAAYFAVDTFFWIGGFLITMGMLQPVRKAKSFIKFYFGAVLHRFIRIWPTYMVAILMYWKIAPYLGSGPIWRIFYNLSCSCNDGGVLWNMFFIDNFGNHGPSGMDYCFGWGWYLAVDFQLFLITPFFLYAYTKNKKLGWLITFLLFVASVVTAFVMIMVNDWRYPIPNPKMAPQPEFMDKFYYKPYIRASAYFMGVFSGFIYVQWKNGEPAIVRVVNKIKNSILIRTLFYVVGIFLCEATIWIIVPFQTGESDWSTLSQAFYNSLNRVFFLFGMYLCVFAAMFGCRYDPVKFILGHWIFSPLAKVSFCIYLTHFIVIMSGCFSARMQQFWQTSSAIYTVISDIFWSILLATCLSCLIESPILALEKVLLRGDKSGEPKAKPLLKEGGQLTQSLMPSESKTVQQQVILPVKISPQNDNSMLL